MTFAVGSLVKAREREWVVLPESSDDFLILRPLGGTDAELAGIDTGLEAVTHASFDLPQVSQLGDFRSSQLLRNAIRLGFRSSAGPFRSFGRIAVEPRPYQLVLALDILFFAFLGLVLFRKLLLGHFSDKVVALCILGIGVGTNYLEYSSISGSYTHGNLFVGYVGVMLLSERFYRNPKISTGAFIGAIVGLAALTRPTELLLGLLPLIWGIAPNRASIQTRIGFLFSNWKALLAAALAGGVILFLQPLYWYLIAGEWIIYSYQDQGFSFLHPHILEGLASFRGGWLPYTPMGILMLAGFWHLWRTKPLVAPAISLYIFIFCYIAWSWDIWWYGGSLGQRTMVQVYPLLGFSLGALLTKSEDGGLLRKALTAIAFAGALLINLFWTHQAHRGGLLKAGEMTRNYYFAVLGTFEEDKNKLKLLDEALIYDKVRVDQQVLLKEDFEAIDLSLACDSTHTLSGNRSYCVREGSEFSPLFLASLPPENATWFRLSTDVDVVQRTWDWWAMVQLIVTFKQQDKKVAANMLRPERLLDKGRQRIYFDGKIPTAPFDRIEIQFWKPGLGGLVVFDNMEMISFREP